MVGSRRRITRPVLPVLLGASLIGALALAGIDSTPVAAAAKPGDWAFPRSDPQNTAYQPQPGDIDQPEVLDKVYVGGGTNYLSSLDLDDDGTPEVLSIEAGVLIARSGDDLSVMWRSAIGFGATNVLGLHDLAGDGDAELVAVSNWGYGIAALNKETGAVLWQQKYTGALNSSRVGIAKLKPSLAGLQIALYPDRARHVTTYAFDLGVANGYQLWTSPDLSTHDYPYTSNVLVADLNADGDNEVAITSYALIETYDGATGAALTTANGGWNGRLVHEAGPGIDGRNYGPFVAVPQPGSPYPLLVLVATGVTMHIEVVNNGPAGLSLRYDKFVGHIYTPGEPQKAVRVTTDAIGGDFLGNGRPHLAVSIYNDTGDDRWHLLVVDLLNGFSAPLLDIPDGYLWGAADFDGNGRTELLVSTESDLTPGESATVRLYSAQSNGTFSQVWSLTGATVLPVRGDISGNGKTAFFVRHNSQLEAYEYASGAVTGVWTHPDTRLLRVANLDADAQVEVVTSDDNGTLRIETASSQVEEAQTALGGFIGQPTVAKMRADSNPSVVVTTPGLSTAFGPTPSGKAHVFRWDNGTAGLEPYWTLPGVGVTPQGAGRVSREQAKADNAVPLFDLDGNGALEMLLTDRVAGQSRVRLVSAGGTTVWTHVFSGADALGSVYMWTVGKFRPGTRKDVFVSGLAGGNDSDISFVLDSATGTVLWRKEEATQRQFGPCCGYPAVSEVGSSGLDRVLLQAKDELWSVHYDTTAAAFHEDDLGVIAFNGSNTLYQTPTIVDVEGDGSLDWLGTSGYRGIFRQQLGVDAGGHVVDTPVWYVDTPDWDLYEAQTAVADVTGDGVTDLGVLHLAGHFQSINADTATHQWSYTVGSNTRGVATADINGDGDVDYVFGTADGRIIALNGALGLSASQRVLWTLAGEIDGPVGQIAVADVDGDGDSEIAATAGDGYLYVIGSS